MAAFEVSLNDAVSGAAKMAGGSVGSLMTAFQGLASGSESVQKTIDGLADMLGQLGPEGKAAAEAIKIVTAVVLGLVDAMVAGAEAAIEITQQKDKLRSTFEALGKGAGEGQKVLDMLEDMSKKLPFTDDQLGEMAKSLMSAGIQGFALKRAIQAVAAAQAIMGTGGAAAADKMIKQLAEGGEAASKMIKAITSGGPKSAKLLADMGLSAADVAKQLGMTPEQMAKAQVGAKTMAKAIEDALRTKGKGPLEDMALTFPVIIGKLKAGFESLFEDLGPAVRPFMKAVAELFGEFNQGSGIMKSLSSVVTTVFTFIFSLATKAVHAVKDLIDGFTGAKTSGGFMVSVGAAIKTVWSAIKTVFGVLATALTPVIGVLKAIFTNSLVLKGIKTLFVIIGVAIGAVVVVIAAVVAAFIFLYTVVYAAIAGVIGVVMGAVGAIVDFASSAIDALSDWASGAVDAAANFISGLITGIKNGAGAVVDAVKGLALGALNAFKGALGIASPSRVMMEMGGFTTDGLAGGIEDGTQDVANASKGMGAAVTAGAVEGSSRGTGRAAGAMGGINVTVEAGAIVIQGAGGDVLELTEEAVAALFERVALEQGLVTSP